MHVPRLETERPVEYPDSDGQPMADNTIQFRWIVTIKENLDVRFPDFVAGDLLWYPVEGDNKLRQAPDVMVALGRPKGYRGSYRQWEEARVAPAVVFEVLSPGNRFGELQKKFRFYERFGVEEYYVFDPDRLTLDVYLRRGGRLEDVENPSSFVSPRLGIRFELGDELEIFDRDGVRFLTFAELMEAKDKAERERADAQRERDDARRERDDAQRRADELLAKLRAAGLEP
ncbi:MAG: Uma2 family endonuclease [Deltaproteobacteria bacterium]|nr:Uma2 family endonuclease [Deltaproteobacteria bacterium]